jgi:hypothetical protein
VEVLGVQAKSTECETCAAPVPERAIAAGEFEALLATATLPVTAPVAAGANVTFKMTVWPGARMDPLGTPLTLKPAPEMLTVEIVILEVPAFLSVTLCELLLDRVTPLKLKKVVLAFNKAVGALTMRVAALLVRLPALFETATVN